MWVLVDEVPLGNFGTSTQMAKGPLGRCGFTGHGENVWSRAGLVAYHEDQVHGPVFMAGDIYVMWWVLILCKLEAKEANRSSRCNLGSGPAQPDTNNTMVWLLFVAYYRYYGILRRALQSLATRTIRLPTRSSKTCKASTLRLQALYSK